MTSSARGKTAVLLTTGLLVESCLRTPAESGYNSANNVRRCILRPSPVASLYQVHQVLLTPLTGEFERAAAFVGTVFEEDHYCSLLTQGSLVFLTRPEGSDNNSTPQFSESQRHAFLTTRTVTRCHCYQKLAVIRNYTPRSLPPSEVQVNRLISPPRWDSMILVSF